MPSNITEDNGKFYMNISSRFTGEYSFRVPKVFIVMNELFKLFTSVLIPTFFVVTLIFILLFLLTDVSEKTAFILGIPIQFAVMFGMGYYVTDGVRDLVKIERSISDKGWFFIITGVISLITLNYVAKGIINIMDLSIGKNQIVKILETNPEYILFLVPAMFLVVAPVEEFVFRGVIQGKAREYYSTRNAIILSGFYFGIVHILSMTALGYGMLVYAFVSMVLGFILGYIYEETDNLMIPIIVHGIYNSVLFILIVI